MPRLISNPYIPYGVGLSKGAAPGQGQQRIPCSSLVTVKDKNGNFNCGQQEKILDVDQEMSPYGWGQGWRK